MKSKRKRLWSLLVCAALVFALLPPLTARAGWADYVDENGVPQSAEVTIIDSSTTVLTDGFYMMLTNVQIDSTLTVSGNASLILLDYATLKVNGPANGAAINVSSGNSLTIYGRANGTGKLIAASNASTGGAGIGASGFGASSGTVTINGGIVEATGGDTSPGIGGCYLGSGGIITINRGVVTATGGGSGAGIGTGPMGSGSTITINGGVVTATSSSGAGIGTGPMGFSGTITINGGVVTATSLYGAGIGTGEDGTAGTISINGGTVKSTGPAGAVSGTPKNSAGDNVYLNALTVPGQANQAPTAGSIGGVACASAADAANGVYGIRGVSTDGSGNLYFYLPASDNSEIVSATVGGTAYTAAYRRTGDTAHNTRTLSNDVTAPTAESVSPADAAADVPVSGVITVTFDETMDTDSGAVTLSGGSLIDGGWSDDTTYTIRYFVSGDTTYTMNLVGFRDAAGNDLAAAGPYAFTTQAPSDTAPPTVVSVSPAGSGAALNGSLVITFSEAMRLTVGTVSLDGGTTSLTGGAWSEDDKVYTVSYVGLYNRDYTVRLAGFEDASGNPLGTNTDHSFVTAGAPYIDENGALQTQPAGTPVTLITASSDDLTTGWYIVDSNVALNATLTVDGDVDLILADGKTLTITSPQNDAGITVPSGSSLTIYGQSGGTGKLIATGGNDAAGIGGGNSAAAGSVTINGGVIEATGKGSYGTASGGAGIGGGNNAAAGTVTINGGTVTATGFFGAGIGSGKGFYGNGITDAFTVTINGGVVTATGTNGLCSAGIGAGYVGFGGTVTINGGTVTATGDLSNDSAGIGKGSYSSNVSVTINGGSIKAAGSIGSISGTPKNTADTSVYLNTLTVPGQANQAVTAGSIGGIACATAPNAATGVYGIRSVSTDGDGKLYFYLPVSTGSEIVGATVGGTVYRAAYQRKTDTASNTKTLVSGDFIVDIAGITGVIPPVAGATPVSAITETDQYTGTVTWSPNESPFASGTAYTATITLTPKSDYTLTGVTADFFTVPGASAVSNAADSGVITAEFPATQSSAKAITGFKIGSVDAAISEADHTIAVTLPFGTDVASLTPTITVSDKAGVSPASGTAQDFTSPVTYTVTAEDGTTQTYTVTVTVTEAPTYGISLDKTGTQTFTGQTEGYDPVTPLTVEVDNEGNQPTGDLTVALSGTNAASFTLSKTAIDSIAVSGSDTLTVGPKTGLSAGTYTATVTVDGNDVTAQSFAVSFTVNPAPTYSVTVQNDGHGTGSADPATAAQGETITLSSSPSAGYHFKEWQVVSPAGLTLTGNTFTMPGEAVTVKAVFDYAGTLYFKAGEDESGFYYGDPDGGGVLATDLTGWSFTGGILTLDGFEWETAARTALAIIGDELTIRLEDGSENAFVSTFDGSGDDDTFGIYMQSGSLTIDGDTGSLTAQGGGTKRGHSCGIYMSTGALEVTGGHVTATSRDWSGGLSGTSGGIGAHAVTISGGTVDAAATDAKTSCYGIFGMDVTVEGGIVNATAGRANGGGTLVNGKGVSVGLLSGAGNVSITGGTVTATSDGATNLSAGIGVMGDATVSDSGGNVLITGGSVTAGAGDGTDDESLSFGIAAVFMDEVVGLTAGSVSISGCTVIATGHTQALFTMGGAITVAPAYRYWTNTDPSDSDATGPVDGSETPFVNASTYKYVKIAPALPTYTATIDPASKAFTEATAGYADQAAQEFALKNTGTGTITGLSAALGGTDFEISAALSVTSIASGGTVTVSVRPMTSLPAGEYTDTLTITGDNAVSLTASLSFTVNPAPTYTVTFNSNGSEYASKTVTAGGSIGGVNWPSDPARGGYTFGGWFTGENGAGDEFSAATTVSASITVYAKWTYSGGEGGGGGGGVPTPVYAAEVSAGDGTGASLRVTVDGAAGASADIGSYADVLAEGRDLTVTMPAIPGVGAYSAGITVSALSSPDGQGTLKIRTDMGSLTVPSDMLAGVSGSNAQITIGQGDNTGLPANIRAAVGDRPLIRLTLSIDGRQSDWNNPDAPVTVSIPYTPSAEELANPESIIIWYIDGSGNAVCISNGHYDAKTGLVTFTTTHFSLYAVGYNPVSFKDAAPGAWYFKAISLIAARGITDGTGNGNYSPDARLTRGEFIVLLMRAYGIAPDANPADNFADSGNTYYTSYLAAAKRLGISNGVGNNKFAPEQEITRQEMFTLLYNALRVIGGLPAGSTGKTLSDFSDASDVASWARDAMALLVETGTIAGSGGELNPTGTTTRAEMAQVLYNLLMRS